MTQKWFAISLLVLSGISLLGLSSCARDQKLVSITLQPSGGFTFEGYGATGQFTAYGNYIHPPETKDISNKVVWSLDIGNFGTLSSTGLITYTRTDGCGSGNVVATFNSKPSDPTAGSVIVGTAPVKGAADGTASCQ